MKQKSVMIEKINRISLLVFVIGVILICTMTIFCNERHSVSPDKYNENLGSNKLLTSDIKFISTKKLYSIFKTYDGYYYISDGNSIDKCDLNGKIVASYTFELAFSDFDFLNGFDSIIIISNGKGFLTKPIIGGKGNCLELPEFHAGDKISLYNRHGYSIFQNYDDVNDKICFGLSKYSINHRINATTMFCNGESFTSAFNVQGNIILYDITFGKVLLFTKQLEDTSTLFNIGMSIRESHEIFDLVVTLNDFFVFRGFDTVGNEKICIYNREGIIINELLLPKIELAACIDMIESSMLDLNPNGRLFLIKDQKLIVLTPNLDCSGFTLSEYPIHNSK